MNLNYHINLADYFTSKPLYLDTPTQKKPNIRKLVEQPWQQTKAAIMEKDNEILWDNITNTLCNLDFIQAKAAAKLTYNLVNDFNELLEVIPDNQKNIKEEKARQARLDKYTQDLIACADGRISIEELEIPESITPWTEEQINAEIERIKTNPTRADKLKDFLNFLGQEAHNLQSYAYDFAHFSYQQAWNFANDGPVGKTSEKLLPKFRKSLLLLKQYSRPKWNPYPQIIKKFKAHEEIIHTFISPEEKRAISCSKDNSITIWNLITGEPIQTLISDTDDVLAVSMTQYEQRVIYKKTYKRTTAGFKHIKKEEESFIIFDPKTNQKIKKLNENIAIKRVFMSPDGQRVLSVSAHPENLITLWDIKTGNQIYTLKQPNGKIQAIQTTDNDCNAVLVLNYEENACVLYDLTTSEEIQIIKGDTSKIKEVSVTPDGQKAITIDYLGASILWDLKTGERIISLKGHSGFRKTKDILITPDGLNILSISDYPDNSIILWDIMTGKQISYLKGHAGYILDISISIDGQRAISTSEDNTCILWNLKTGKHIYTLLGHTGSVRVVSITPDGKKAITGSVDKTCILWDLNTGKLIHILKGHTGEITAVSISNDGQSAISGSVDKTCILWNLKTGKKKYTLIGHDSYIKHVSFTPDNQNAISVSFNTSILWDINKGLQIYSKRFSVGFKDPYITPDGQRAFIYDSSVNLTYILLDLKTGEQIETIKGLEDFVSDISISSDGQNAITVLRNNTCILWNLKTKEKNSLVSTKNLN